jgi:16S rRNA (uracil1498-N3)-methyltransferase
MSSLRRFCLARSPLEGEPELHEADREHALRVLRVAPGERILGLDGRGRAWELEVESVQRRGLKLRPRGSPRTEPPPGSPDAPLPWIEVACPLPKAGRAEVMLDRLTQLGLARLVPLRCERSEPQTRGASKGRSERLERAARESLKQCGRLWLPEIAHPEDLEGLLEKSCPRVLLDPAAEASLSRVLCACGPRSAWTRAAPLLLIAGPEGGFSPRESAALRASGALPARLAPHVLRIETAVEAALAVAVERCFGGE